MTEGLHDLDLLVREIQALRYRIAELEAEAQRFKTTLYSIGDAVIVVDADANIVQMNGVAEQLTGWGEASTKGRPLVEVFRIVSEDPQVEVESPIEEILRTGATIGMSNHTTLIARDGTRRPIAHTGSPIRDANHTIAGAVLVFRDQTEARLVQAEIVETQKRFQAFFDDAPIGKSMTGPDGILLRVNRAFSAMLGYSLEEMRSISFAAITHSDDIAESRECIRALLAGERDTWAMEKRYIAKNGHLVWTHVVTRLRRDSQGTPLHFLTHVFDITERKLLEVELLERKTLLKNLIESSGSAIFSLDREYRYSSFNSQHAGVMKALYGVDIELGHSLLDYQRSTEDHVQAKRNIDRALAGESFTDAGYSGENAKTRAYFEVSHHPIRDDACNIVGVAVFARDTTAQRRAEEELRVLNAELDRRVGERTAQLEASNQELDAFSYSVSHDLRAPLRAIDGFTRILVDEYAAALNTEGMRLCTIVRENTAKMSRLIDDLLAFSRLGRAAMSLGRVDMRTMANSVFLELTTVESRSRVDFRVGSLPEAVADSTLIRQVWMNLLSNALKFSSKRERASIQVFSEPSVAETVYGVRDDGAGFDMQYQDKLFGVFQRLHSSREFDGTGVGLALVQRVIRRHNGKVWAEGRVGQGATFYFSLPSQGDLT